MKEKPLEEEFIRAYEKTYRSVDAAIDMKNNDLSQLVRSAVEMQGVISSQVREQFTAKGYSAEVLTAAQNAIAALHSREAEIAEERQDRIAALEALGTLPPGPRKILWKIAKERLREAAAPNQVAWSQVNQLVMDESITNVAGSVSETVRALAQCSPGCATPEEVSAVRKQARHMFIQLVAPASRYHVG